MATYTTTDGRKITSTSNPDGTKTKNITHTDGSKTTEIYDPRTRTTKPGESTPAPSAVTQKQASTLSTKDLSIALASPIKSPVPATQIQPSSTINLPEPVAPEIQKVNNSSIQSAVDVAKNNLSTVLTGQRTEVQKEINALTKEQDAALAAGKELTKPFRADLEKKQRDKLKIDENFQANQKLTNELEGLLTQSNELINIATGRQVSGKILNKSLSKTLGDVQARAGVIQAVMAARNDQISVANNFIDRTVEAIVADRNDQLSYYNTIISLADSKLINLNSEKYKIATTERNQAIKDVESAQATADYVKSLMINPESAQFMADAGVSLTDTVEGVKTKMAAQAKTQEAIDMRNSLVDAGYDISAVPVPGGIEVQAGGQTLYAKVRSGSELDLNIQGKKASIEQSRASAANSRASAARTETGSLLDLAAAGDPASISALGLTIPDGTTGNKEPSIDLIAYANQYAATGKLPTASTLPKGISVGDVAELARSLPKPDGAIVSMNTGVADTKLTGEQSKAIVAMNEIVNDTFPFMLQKWDEAQSTNFGGTGVLGGISSKVLPSQAMTEYLQARDEFLSRLLVARSGAAVTEQEYARYLALVPGAFNSPFFLGKKGDTLLNNLDDLMVRNFDNYLASNQLSVYGYSKIDGGEGVQYTVGEVIENEYGQQGFIQPDGSVTLINP